MTKPIVPQVPRTPQEWVDELYSGEDIPAEWPADLQAKANLFLNLDYAVYETYIRKQSIARTDDRVAWQAAQFAWQVAQDNRNVAEKSFRIACFAWQEGQGR